MSDKRSDRIFKALAVQPGAPRMQVAVSNLSRGIALVAAVSLLNPFGHVIALPLFVMTVCAFAARADALPVLPPAANDDADFGAAVRQAVRFLAVGLGVLLLVAVARSTWFAFLSEGVCTLRGTIGPLGTVAPHDLWPAWPKPLGPKYTGAQLQAIQAGACRVNVVLTLLIPVAVAAAFTVDVRRRGVPRLQRAHPADMPASLAVLGVVWFVAAGIAGWIGQPRAKSSAAAIALDLDAIVFLFALAPALALVGIGRALAALRSRLSGPPALPERRI